MIGCIKHKHHNYICAVSWMIVSKNHRSALKQMKVDGQEWILIFFTENDVSRLELVYSPSCCTYIFKEWFCFLYILGTSITGFVSVHQYWAFMHSFCSFRTSQSRGYCNWIIHYSSKPFSTDFYFSPYTFAFNFLAMASPSLITPLSCIR